MRKENYQELAKQVEKKLETFENRSEQIRKALADRDSAISVFEKKIEAFDNTVEIFFLNGQKIY